MIYELIALWSIPFWIMIAAGVVIVLFAIENDSGRGATVGTAAVLALILFFTNSDLFAWVYDNPLTFVEYVAAYFIAGAAWSMLKWWLYLLGVREKYDSIRALWMQSHKMSSAATIPDQLKNEWRAHVAGRFSGKFPPQATDHKASIMLWISYWPVSSFWTLLNDPLKRIAVAIYNVMGNVYQRISNAMFSEIGRDA